MTEPLLIAKSKDKEIALLPQLANRHGLITGATGTGKTVTLQKMAESFASIGVPVFMADVKGDLSGIGAPGVESPKLKERLAALGIDEFTPRANTAVFWDVFGEAGHPVRATVSDMGPLLLARLLNLNDTQAGVLQLVFKIADDQGLLLLDLKDLRAMVQNVGDNAKNYTTEYGNIAAASIGAIQRGLLTLEEQGGDVFFGEPMLDINDLMQTDDGKGIVNILAADKLMAAPRLYSTFLLWLLAELLHGFIIDGLQAVLVGLLVREFKPANVVIGSLVAGVWKVFGYFIAGGILSGFGPALGEIIGNSFQMVVGLIVGFALFSAVRKAYPPLVRLGNLSVKAGE